MDTRAYLHRIGWKTRPAADAATLHQLQLAHLRHVPFENLSIHIGEQIRLDERWLFDKIVVRRRGGFCYELNGLFGHLLEELGYQVALLSARVRAADGTFGPEFDHLVLKVDLEESWLVDVGFGRAFKRPLALRPDEEQVHGSERFKLTRSGEEYTYWRFENEWQAEYRFTATPRVFSDFNGMCRHHQTSPDSPFTRRWLATILTKTGRDTLHQAEEDFRYIVTDGSGRHERIIHGMDNAQILLEEIFGISPESLQPPGRKKRKQ